MPSPSKICGATLVLVAFGVGCVCAADLATSTVQVAWEAKLNDKVISLISVPGGDLARIQQPDGRMLAMGVEVLNQTDQDVLFRLLEVKTFQGEEIIKQVEKFSVRAGAAHATAWNPSLEIRVKAIRTREDGGKAASEGLASAGPPTDDLIHCVVTDHQRPITITGRGNELVRLKMDDRQWGFVPTLEAQGAVRFRIFSVKTVDPQHEILEERESFGLKLGGSAAVKFLPEVSIRLSSVVGSGQRP